MVAQQRHAVFNLVIALAALSLFAALIPFFGLVKAQAGFAVLGITGLGPLLLRRRSGQVISDERDRSIFLSATQISFAVFWLLFVGGVMAVYYTLKTRAVPVEVLPLVVWLGWAILLVTHSTTLLILYQRS